MQKKGTDQEAVARVKVRGSDDQDYSGKKRCREIYLRGSDDRIFKESTESKVISGIAT